MKQLSSFMVFNVDGGNRVTYTYNTVDDKTGDLISQNNQENFIAVDSDLTGHIDAIREFIRAKRLVN